MGGLQSKTFTREGLIKYFESPNSCKLILKEHKKIMKAKVEGTFSASLSAAGNDQNESQERNLCFDHSLVASSDEGPFSFYNASYIEGFNRPREYVVGESPTSETASIFWQKIWSEKTEIIVMMNDPEDDGGYFYWGQEMGSSLQFGPLTVQTLRVLPYSSFKTTLLLVRHENGSELFVNHFMFRGWMKHEITPPESDLFELRSMVQLYNQSIVTLTWLKDYTSPTVVLSSDGLGRAMVYCAIDMCISRYLATGRVNLFSTVSKLRRQRFNCFNDATLYCFCYVALYYYFTWIAYK